MAKCQALADWQGYAARRTASDAAGKCRGRSLVYYIDNTGIFNERMELRFDPDGELTILAGTLSHGQGHETAYAQMAADWLGVAEDKIRLAQADTDDIATVINPLLAKGQIMGGVAQGAGQALCEDVVYDGDGQQVTGTLLDYAIPRADTLSAIQIDFSPVPSKSNPLGIKGVGEGGTVAATPTVMNAIVDALAPLGVSDVAMPATPERIWRAIQAARGA